MVKLSLVLSIAVAILACLLGFVIKNVRRVAQEWDADALLDVCKCLNDQRSQRDAGLVPLTGFNDSTSLGIIHVAYAADAGSLPGLLPSMLSVARHLKADAECVIHVIVPQSDMFAAKGMVDCFYHEAVRLASTVSIRLHEFQPLPFNVHTYRRYGGDCHPLMFARFYLPEYMPGVPRVIWLDTDTIANTDLGLLYRLPMKHMVAAAWDIDATFKGYNGLFEKWNRSKIDLVVSLVSHIPETRPPGPRGRSTPGAPPVH